MGSIAAAQWEVLKTVREAVREAREEALGNARRLEEARDRAAGGSLDHPAMAPAFSSATTSSRPSRP